METLADLITRQLASRGETLTAFAERIGSNRQTIRGWQSSLPAPAMLARVAASLELPYAVVLTAALRSAEYIEGLGDIVAGHTVHAVARCDGSGYERGEFAPTAVFTDSNRAREFVEISNAVVDDADFELAPLVIDAAEPPPAVRVFTLSWSNRTDRIAETSVLVGEVPTRLQGLTVSAINGLELADTGEIYRLHVDSLDPRAGREALQGAIEQLRAEGRLLSPEVDTRSGRFIGPSEWLLEESLLAGVAPFESSRLAAAGWRSAQEVLEANGNPQSPVVPGLPDQAARIARVVADKMPSTPHVFGGPRPPQGPTTTLISLTEAREGDIGVVGGRTVLVVGPGEIVGPTGQRQPISDLVDEPDFAGLFRVQSPGEAPTGTSNHALRQRRVVIDTRGLFTAPGGADVGGGAVADE